MPIRMLRGGIRHAPLLRLLLLSSISCLGGVADSNLSPYYCPAARKRGISVAQCGLVISVRFITQVIFMLIFGRLMRNLGARKIYCIGVIMSCTFHIIFGTLDWVNNHDLYFGLSFIFVILSTVGDAGIFCSIYVLAAEVNLFGKPLDGTAINKIDENRSEYTKTSERIDQGDAFLSIVEPSDNKTDNKSQSKAEDLNAFGPAWMETMYASGIMAGPPLGGLLYEYGGFPLTFITTGVIMTITGILTIPAYLNLPVFHSYESTQPPASHFTILRLPLILIGCLVMFTSGICVSWYLPSLESFLSTQHSLTPSTIGFVYMVYGTIYTIFTPIFGHLIDKGLSHLSLLIFAAFSNVLGYLIMGPSPILSFLPTHICFTIFGLLLSGLGVSANAITCLSLMNHEAEKSGFGTGETTAGITTSLWEVSELLGGYFGSTVGGFAANSWGFPASTNCVVVVEVFILFILMTAYCTPKSREIAMVRRQSCARVFVLPLSSASSPLTSASPSSASFSAASESLPMPSHASAS